MAIKIAGAYVEVRGDYTKLKKDMDRAKGVVRTAAGEMSDALGNALSPQQLKRNLNSLVRNLSTLERHSKVTSRVFSSLSVDLEEVAHVTGLTSRAFEKLQHRMFRTQAARTQERAFRAIQRQAGLTSLELARLRMKLGDAKGAMREYARVAQTSLGRLRSSVLSLKGAMLALGVGYVVRDLFQAGMAAEDLDNAFKAIFGSTQAASREMAWLREVAKRLGQNFWVLADAYKGIAASAKDTVLQGQATHDIFEAIVTASTVLRMSSDQTKGALKAVAQIMSKGKVQAEELRGQLGERLYGAFQLAAKAMGWTTAQLDDMLKKGMVPAAEFLPRLARIIMEQLGGGVKDAANSARAALNRYNEAWMNLRVTLAQSGFMDAAVATLREIVDQLKGPDVQAAIQGFAASWSEIAKVIPTAISDLGGLISTVGAGWKELPSIIREVGLVGALIGGVKGKVIFGALLAMGAMIDKAKELVRENSREFNQTEIGKLLNWSKAKLRDWGVLDEPQGYRGLDNSPQAIEEWRRRAQKHWRGGSNWGALANDWSAITSEIDTFGEEVKRKVKKLPPPVGTSTTDSDKAIQKRLNLMFGAETKYSKIVEREERARDALRKRASSLWAAYTRKNLTQEERALRSLEDKTRELARVQGRRFDEGEISATKYRRFLSKLYADHDRQVAAIEARAATRKRKLEYDYALESARLAGDTRRVKELELKAYLDTWRQRGLDQVHLDELKQLKLRELNKSTLQRVLEDWTDTGRQMEALSEQSLRSIQGGFKTFFSDLLRGGKDAFDNLWKAFENIAINAIAQVATIMTTNLFARGVAAIIPGVSMPSMTGGPGTGFSLPGLGGGGNLLDFSWMSASGSVSALPGGITSGPVTQWGMLNADQWAANAGLFGQGGWLGTGLSGAGAAASGIGGALTGWQVSKALFGDTTAVQIGGGLGGAAGGIAGAAIGAPLGPAGMAIGAMLGGALGGAAGGGLGSLFGGDDKKKEAEEAFKRFKGALNEGIDNWTDYANLVADFHKSDNRARQVISSDQLRAMAVNAGIWYAPDAYQVSGAGGELGKGYWMARTLGGQLADWASQMPDAEGLVEFGDALDDIGQKMGPWSAALKDVLEGLDLTSMSSSELAYTINGELNPATIIQTQLQEDLAGGMDRLAAHKKALGATIDALLGTVDLEKSKENELIDLLMKQSGSVADLTAKYNRYQEIQRKLQDAHKLSREEVQRLVDEGRRLRGELGLQQVSWNDVNNSISKLVGEIGKLVDSLNRVPRDLTVTTHYRYVGTPPADRHHSGGLVYHSGGLVDQALRSGLISWHGGAQRRHGGGFAPSWPRLALGEVPAILQRGEYVVRRSSVTPETLPILDRLNRLGRGALAGSSPQGAAPAPIINLNVSVQVDGNGAELSPEAVGQAVAEAVERKLAQANNRGLVFGYRHRTEVAV